MPHNMLNWQSNEKERGKDLIGVRSLTGDVKQLDCHEHHKRNYEHNHICTVRGTVFTQVPPHAQTLHEVHNDCLFGSVKKKTIHP